MSTPHDVSNLVMYQIFLRPFTPEGTLKSAEAKLTHLAECGVNAVYLCPITTSDDNPNQEFWSNRQRICGLNNPQNPYRVKDYFQIDPEYGTDQDLMDFVDTAHSLGMKVLLDLVYLHCGPSSTIAARHPEFLQHNPDGSIVTNYYRFPVIDFDSPALREYFWNNMVYFVSRFDVDGYRCDCGDHIPLDFWWEGIRRISEIKPDNIMLNEGGNPEFLRGKNGFETCYHGAARLHEILEGAHTTETFRASRTEIVKKHPEGGRYIDFQENHDFANDAYENRLEKRIGSDAMEASLLVAYTFNGIPFLYCGNEIADCSRHSILGNRTHGPELHVDWSRAETEEGKRRFAFLKKAAALRAASPALIRGELEWIENSAPDSILSYARFTENQRIHVLINASRKPVSFTLTAPYAQITPHMEHLAEFAHADGVLHVTLGACGYLVY